MADQRDDFQERTEQATPKREREAREKGHVARSRELSTTALLLFATAGLLLTGPSVLQSVSGLMRQSFTVFRASSQPEVDLVLYFQAALMEVLQALAPFLLLSTVAAIAAPLALGGWVFSAQAFAFKWEKLNPIKGVKRIFSWVGLMELAKALIKFVLIMSVTLLAVWYTLGDILAMGRQGLWPSLNHLWDTISWGFLVVCATTGLIAAIDVPFQIWNNARQMRMTRQQVKDELKETEGNPEVKARVRALQRDLAQRRMMEAISTADVVITNPSHYAVALNYKPETMNAPRLVAKGVDLVAHRIRVVAQSQHIPVVSSPALARAVYFHTKIDHEIPGGLYVAVAHVLAYVYRLREHVGDDDIPLPPDDLPIPDDLRKDDK